MSRTSTPRPSYKYLVMWCNTGLEFIYDLADWERRKVWSALQGAEVTDNPPDLRVLIIRARANPQRHYELYIIETTDGDIDTMRECFEHSPQTIVDLIRERGTKVYSDRECEKAMIV